jgi:hypothetical protein
MKVTVAFPTANADAADSVLHEWRRMGYRTAVLIDPGMRRPAADVVIIESDWRGYAAAMNRLSYDLRGSFDILVAAADDLLPDVDQPAACIAETYCDMFPQLDGVMQPTGDRYGQTGPAAVSPWIGARFIAHRYGGRGPYWPGYHHLFCDTELAEVARRRECYAEVATVAQYHRHWSRGHEDTLPAHRRAEIVARARLDRELFEARLSHGFPHA